MDFILLMYGMSVQTIFFFKREILFNKKQFIALCIVGFVTFVIGEILQYSGVGDPKFMPMLKMPILSLLVFFLFSRIYYNIYLEEPVDTYWSMDISKMKDGVFNFLFFFFGLMIPMFLLYFVKI